MKKYVFEGKNYQILLNEKLYELNIEEKDAIIKCEELKEGLFKSKKYKLEIIKKEDIINKISEIIKSITNLLEIDTKIEILKKEDKIEFNLYSDDVKTLIGFKGKVVDSISIMIKQYLEKEEIKDFNFTLDAGFYHKNIENKIIREAKKLAKEVSKTKVAVILDEMNSYQRRLVHNALSNYKDIYTESEGEGKERRLIIKPKID